VALRRRDWRIRASGGHYDINLPAPERELLAHLLPQLREVIEGPTDERSRRLFPTAYPDDPERDAEYQRFMRDELVTSRLAALDRFVETAKAKSVDEETLVGWMQSINSLRLVLGTLLDVSEDLDFDDVSENHPNYPDYALYGYLSGLLDEIVSALSGDQTPPR
jgi:hypothetical protein